MKNKSLVKNANTILNSIATQEQIEKEFESQSFYKWEGLKNKWFKESKRFTKLKNILLVIQILLGIAPYFISLATVEITNKTLILVIWIVYAIVFGCVSYVYNSLPNDYKEAVKDIKIMKLVSVSEKLAIQLALLTNNRILNLNDDKEFIEQISYRVVDFSEMNEEKKAKIIRYSIEGQRAINSRDTGIVFDRSEINLGEDEYYKLNSITRDVCEVAQILFGGKGYSAKLYLKIVKEVPQNNSSKSYSEILTAFSRFPTKDNFGTSWINSNGYASKTWDCLNKGQSNIYRFENEGLYYESILSVWLPGGIGVLNIQNENPNIFDNKNIDMNSKIIALYTVELIHDAFELNK